MLKTLKMGFSIEKQIVFQNTEKLISAHLNGHKNVSTGWKWVHMIILELCYPRVANRLEVSVGRNDALK